MSYAVKEIYATLQGEGAHTGRRAVFLRFAGCNLWTGRDVDRADAVCTFCDTDFVGTDGQNGGKFASADALADAVAARWPGGVAGAAGRPYVVCTGGEPLLQVDQALIEALHASGCQLAVATGKSRKGLERAFASSGLGRYFTASRCADECFSKPHPQMLEELMDEFAVSSGQTLMIGDTTHDMQMAVNAGVAGLAVTYGAHTRDDLSRLKPLACLDDVAQLALWLKRNV